MKKTEFKARRGRKLHPDHMTKIDQSEESLTVQNEEMSIQDLYAKAAMSQGFEFVDDDEEDELNLDSIDLEEFNRLDIHEQHEVIDYHNDVVKRLQSAHKEKQKEEAKKKDNSEASEGSEIAQNQESESQE